MEKEVQLARPDWMCRFCDWRVVRCRSESGFEDHLRRIHRWDWLEAQIGLCQMAARHLRRVTYLDN